MDHYREAVISLAKAWLKHNANRKEVIPANVDPALWATLDESEKLFVMVHESMHELYGSK